MSRPNWGRFLVGGLVASLIAFMTDGFLHERLIHPQWQALLGGLTSQPPGHDPSAFVYFGIFELGRGFLAMFLYVMMRSRFGPGPMTALGAGVVSWLAFSIAGPAQFIPLGLFNHALWCRAGAFQLVTSIVASIAGAWAYRE